MSFISIPTDVKLSEAYNMRYKNLKPRISQENKDILSSGLLSCPTKVHPAPLNQEKKQRSLKSLMITDGVLDNWKLLFII